MVSLLLAKLTTVKPGFDVAEAVGDGLADREAAWGFIRGFLAAWTTPLSTTDACDDAELDAAEARLGMQLPASLREGYALLGRREKLCSQDPLRSPAALVMADGILYFRDENQWCAHWGIRETDLDLGDPPVVVQTDTGQWIPFLDRTSLAFVELVLTETILRDDDLRNSAELPASLFPVLHEHFRRVQFPDHPSWCASIPGPTRFFAAPGILIRVDGDEDLDWIHVAGQTRSQRRRILDLLPIDWQ